MSLSILKYDPFILKLIYSKTYYLDHLITIYLTWLAPSSMSSTNGTTKRDNDMKLMQFLIQRDYHIKIINRDVEQLERQLNSEKNAKTIGLYKFDLFYANFEFCLYRLWLIHHYTQKACDTTFNVLKNDYIEDCQFCCEIVMSNHVNNKFNDRERLVYQSLIERYIKDFYFDPNGFDAERVKSRINLFLTTKVAVENALFKKYYAANREKNNEVVIYHTKESLFAIQLIYFTNEFIHYLHRDTRYAWISKNHPSNVDYYNKETGITTNGGECSGDENGEMVAALEQLKAEILDTCITRLYLNIDVSPSYDMTQSTSAGNMNKSEASNVISSFMNYFSNTKEAEATTTTSENVIQYQSLEDATTNTKLVIKGVDNDTIDVANILIDYENEFDKESYYHSYRKNASNIFSSKRNGGRVDDTQPHITRQDEKKYNRFIRRDDGQNLIEYLNIDDSDGYYDNITRVFLFDIRLAKNHTCKKNIYGKPASFTRPTTYNSSEHHSLSRPIFHCSICRYEYSHGNYQEFYDTMNLLSYHKKLSSSSTQLSRTVLYRKDMSKRLAIINIDMVEKRYAFIYKILHMSYLIPYHTSIISKEYMKNLVIINNPSIIPSMVINRGSNVDEKNDDPYTVISMYENFFSFINIDVCITDMQKGLVNKKTQSRLERILIECQKMNLSSMDSIIAIGPILSDDSEEEVLTLKPTNIMCGLATEILLLVILMQSISNQLLKNEKRESSKNVTKPLLESRKVKRNDDIMKCINTIYCYYMYTLGMVVQSSSLRQPSK